MSAAPHPHPRAVDERLLARAFERSNAPRWGLPAEAFARALERSIATRFATEVRTPSAVQAYVESLNLEELALASACAEGQVAAWAFFIDCYRPALRTAARAIAGDGAGDELADSLFGDLYGLETREGTRRSLFDYFHGRSRLSTWLRSILAQRNIDRIRAARRTQPLDEESDALAAPSGEVASSQDPDRQRYAALVQRVLAGAIGRLVPVDRLRLSAYYLQRLTLAQIGRLMGEHEATACRKLDRIRKDLRADVERQLRDHHRLNPSQVAACFEAALDDTGFDLGRVLGTDAQTTGRKDEGVVRSERRSST